MTSNIRTFSAPRGPKSETLEKFPGPGQRLGSDTSTKEQAIDMPDQQTPAEPSKQASGQRMGGEYTHEGNIVKSNVLEGAGHQKFGQGLNIGRVSNPEKEQPTVPRYARPKATLSNPTAKPSREPQNPPAPKQPPNSSARPYYSSYTHKGDIVSSNLVTNNAYQEFAGGLNIGD